MMAPKQDRVYARGRSKYVAPSSRLVIGSDDERDLEYVPPGTSTPSTSLTGVHSLNALYTLGTYPHFTSLI